ncbi:helix-turn-helix domain-containing protein, partial [Paenibacillus phytorum]|uniref:helix-turn-helix domain-containing protein n=1 Tax=Paenibacillus phytorum TaxID=2654977 RepID=UPI001491B4CB
IEKSYLSESNHLLLGYLNLVELHKLFFMLLLESDITLTPQSKYAVINEFTIEVIHPIMIRITNLFSEWPFNFHDFLKRYKSKWNSSRQEGVNKDFGSFYSVLYSSFGESQFDFLRNEFEKYITQHWTGGHVSRFTKISNRSSKYISAAKAFQNYGINGINICRLIDQGLISGKFIEKNSSKIILIEETSLISYVNKLSGTLPSYQAAEYLGISENTLLDLLEHKCISAFRGPLVDGYSHWHYEKEIIDGMLTEIDQKIVPLDPEIDERVLKFRTIVQNPRYPCNTGKFVKLILEGKIRPCDKLDGLGFTCYLFREKEILNYFSDEMNKSKSNLSINEVSHILKLKREEINKLIRAGLLPGDCKGKGKRSDILRVDLELFMEKYISLSEITRSYQSNVRFMLRVLSKLQIMPIVGSDVGLVYLFDRKEISENEILIQQKFATTPLTKKSKMKKF